MTFTMLYHDDLPAVVLSDERLAGAWLLLYLSADAAGGSGPTLVPRGVSDESLHALADLGLLTWEGGRYEMPLPRQRRDERTRRGRADALMGRHRRGEHDDKPHPACPLCQAPLRPASGPPEGSARHIDREQSAESRGQRTEGEQLGQEVEDTLRARATATDVVGPWTARIEEMRRRANGA